LLKPQGAGIIFDPDANDGSKFVSATTMMTWLIEGRRVPVAVVMERRTLANRWQSIAWQLSQVVPDAPRGTANGATPMPEALPGDCWLHRGLTLQLFTDEGEGYWLNLTSGSPVIFVMWRLEDDLAVPKIVTVSYNEAGRMLDGGEQVENVPLPAGLAEWLADFTQAHYRPEPKKRARPPSFKGARRDE
jgi:hypothetical protein